MAQQASIRSIVSQDGRDGTSLSSNIKTGEIGYATNESPTDLLTVQVGFNRKTGELNFIRNNGEVLTISGFLTSSQLGEGPRGRKGTKGRNGRTGYLGRDGKKGKKGCEGPLGAKGIIGDRGLDGNDGLRGIIGLYGLPGAPGMMGPTGATGIEGFQGPIGAEGPNCMIGLKGETGPTASDSVFYGTDTPPSQYYVWAIPYKDGEIIEDPVAIEPLSGNVRDQDAQLALVTSDSFAASITLSVSNLIGGAGPFTYRWESVNGGLEATDISVDGSLTNNTLKVNCFTVIDPQETFTYTGEVKLTITDTGDSNNRFVIEDIFFTFEGYNDRSSNETGSDDGAVIVGGGGGFRDADFECLHEDTPIVLYSGETVKAKYIQPGDTLKGLNSNTMVDDSVDNWRDWRVPELQDPTVVSTTVVASWQTKRDHYWHINSYLKVTEGHPLLVFKNGEWGWHDANFIEVGDKLWGMDGSINVDTIERVNESINIVLINAEPYDTYFAGDIPILVHNK